MKTDQEQIEEMAYSICNKFYIGEPKNCTECTHKTSCHNIDFAKAFYSANCRKTSNVIDEFVEKLKELLNKHEHRSQTDGVLFYQMDAESFCDEIDKLAAEMRQEVDK